MNCFKDHTIFVVHKFNSSGTCLPWVLSFRLISPLMIKKYERIPLLFFCNRKRVAFQTFFHKTEVAKLCLCESDGKKIIQGHTYNAWFHEPCRRACSVCSTHPTSPSVKLKLNVHKITYSLLCFFPWAEKNSTKI